MSRMYHNEPLSSIPVNTHHVKFIWNKQCSGNGVILEGTITKRTRHVIVDSQQDKTRYFVLHVSPQRVHRRQFDENGQEVEPNFSETGKVRQGFLHSSYKTVAKGESDQLSTEQARKTVACSAVDSIIQSHRTSDNTLALWVEERQLDKIELENGDKIRVKTTANCPFVDTIAKLDSQSSTVSNYAGGEQVGGSWTDKVMAVKADTQKPLPQDMVEGVDDDEWDD